MEKTKLMSVSLLTLSFCIGWQICSCVRPGTSRDEEKHEEPHLLHGASTSGQCATSPPFNNTSLEERPEGQPNESLDSLSAKDEKKKLYRRSMVKQRTIPLTGVGNPRARDPKTLMCNLQWLCCCRQAPALCSTTTTTTPQNRLWPNRNIS